MSLRTALPGNERNPDHVSSFFFTALLNKLIMTHWSRKTPRLVYHVQRAAAVTLISELLCDEPHLNAPVGQGGNRRHEGKWQGVDFSVYCSLQRESRRLVPFVTPALLPRFWHCAMFVFESWSIINAPTPSVTSCEFGLRHTEPVRQQRNLLCQVCPAAAKASGISVWSHL